jgi:LysM repeat protein
VLWILPVLTACFRPAGESIAATPAAALPANSSLSTSGSNTALNIQATAQETLNSDTALNNGVAVTVIGATQPPSNVQGVATLAITPIGTATPQFITPGAPLGLITPDTPNPAASTAPGTPSAATNTPSGLITPTSLPGADDECLYVVQPGDSLYAIAINNDTTVDGLIAANPELTGDPPIIYPGDPLILSDCGDLPVIAGTTNANVTIATATNTVPTIAPFSGTTTGGSDTTAGGDQIYTVQAGDSLFVIAQRFGTTVNAIVEANNLSNPNALQIGQQLIIPGS